MAKQYLLAVLAPLVVIGVILSAFVRYNYKQSVPDRIINTVVAVEDSTGIVAYSNGEITLVLTAFHVIKNKIDINENSFAPIVVSLKEFVAADIVVEESYDVVAVIFDVNSDLALLKIGPTERIFSHANMVSTSNEPKLGDEIWIAGNPLKNYRSLKRGEISSKINRFNIYGSPIWELGGGAIFGASGGGIFTMDGDLSGIIVSVAVMRLACYEEIDDSGEISEECLLVPVTYISHAAPPNIINEFLLKGEFKEYFKYLEE